MLCRRKGQKYFPANSLRVFSMPKWPARGLLWGRLINSIRMASGTKKRPWWCNTLLISWYRPFWNPCCLSSWALESISYSSYSRSCMLSILALYGFLLANSKQNMSQNWHSCGRRWVMQIKPWWSGNRFKLADALSSEGLSPNKLALVSKNCK